MADIVDHGIVPGDTGRIFRIGALMPLVAVVGTACAVAGSYFSSRVATGFGRRVRNRIFDRVARFSVHQFDHFSATTRTRPRRPPPGRVQERTSRAPLTTSRRRTIW